MHALRVARQDLGHPARVQQRGHELAQLGQARAAAGGSSTSSRYSRSRAKSSRSTSSCAAGVREIRERRALRRGDQRARAVQPGDDDGPVHASQPR